MLQLDNPSCDFWAVLFQTLFSVVQELRKRDDKLMQCRDGWFGGQFYFGVMPSSFVRYSSGVKV